MAWMRAQSLPNWKLRAKRSPTAMVETSDSNRIFSAKVLASSSLMVLPG